MSCYKDVTGDQKVSSRLGSRSVLLTERCQGEQIKEAKMGGSRGTYGVKEKCIQGFGGETLWKETIWKTMA
jgi:hypothetical protein